MLTSSVRILQAARRGKYAVGAFNISNLEGFKVVLDAALKLKSPVIIQTSEAAVEYGGAEYLRAIAYTASKSPVPFAFHVDHGKDIELIKHCIKLGWTSVMFDGSKLPYPENLKKTTAIAKYAHARGVSVEGELGAIKGKEDHVSVSEREAFFTEPAQAVEFAQKTGVDALAISIGTAHGPYKFEGETVLDFKRLKTIAQLVSLPLVLHGASGIDMAMVELLHKDCTQHGDCVRLAGAGGVSDEAIRKAISLGISKINIDSDLRIAFTAGLRSALLDHATWYDPRTLLTEASAMMAATVEGKMKLFKSAGKAK